VAKQSAETGSIKIVTVNKKGRFRYHLFESFEAGIVLSGTEIKSIREGGVSIEESYVRPEEDALYWIGAHINPYSHSDNQDYNPTRTRKLLMHKHEIDKLRGRVEAKGLTIVPVKLYLKRGRAKLEIALAKGKDAPDKRKTIKERELKRETERAMKSRKQ